MAQTNRTPRGKVMFPLNKVIKHFVTQSDTQIHLNFYKQGVFPGKMPPRYNDDGTLDNRQKKSSGKGYKSILSKVVVATEKQVTVEFSYLMYLDFVDIGAGFQTRGDDVDRKKNARITSQYTSVWVPELGLTHRPILYKELGPYGHLATRIKNYLSDYYAWDAEMRYTEVFEDIKPITIQV